jgi:hypothetical protein
VCVHTQTDRHALLNTCKTVLDCCLACRFLPGLAYLFEYTLFTYMDTMCTIWYPYIRICVLLGLAYLFEYTLCTYMDTM